MQINQIATIRTDFPEKFGIPRQSGLVPGLQGRIEFVPEYRSLDAVRGMEGFSHLWLIWQFSKAIRKKWSATVSPPRLGGRKRVGVFASRSPFRPNPLGLSCVVLERISYEEKNSPILYVSGVDMLDGTPIYDIKPYLPYADSHPEARGGFGAEVSEHQLEVDFPEELLSVLPYQHRENAFALLQQDPRTAFIHDENRVWGVAYAEYNIRFTVRGKRLTVCQVQRLGD